MPVEIREIIIKTEIVSGTREHSGSVKEKDINTLKKQLLEECKRLIAEQTKRNNYKR